VKRRNFVPAVVSLLTISSVAWAWQQAKVREALGGELAQTPERYRARSNSYERQPDAVKAGRKLFKHHCAQCHGDDARGSEEAPDLRADVIQNSSPGTLFWFLRNGNLKEGMPSWSRLPDERLWQLVSYLKTLK
jgi:mono/diheme cytochrome c family protein